MTGHFTIQQKAFKMTVTLAKVIDPYGGIHQNHR